MTAATFPKSEAYSRHSANLASVAKSYTQIELIHKNAIRNGADSQVGVMQQIQHFHSGMYAEAFLRKIISDPTGFNDNERVILYSVNQQISRWEMTVKLAFRRHYDVLIHQNLEDVLSSDRSANLMVILNLFDDELRSTIEDRNKIAHGQPIWQLKSRSENGFKIDSGPQYFGNYLDQKKRFEIIKTIGDMVTTLVVSKPTFERDFKSQLATLMAARDTLANYDSSNGHEYNEFVRELRRTRPKFNYPKGNN